MKKHVILIAVACTLSALPLFGTFYEEVSTFFSKELPTQLPTKFRNLVQVVPEGMANPNSQIASFTLPVNSLPKNSKLLPNGLIRFTGQKNDELPILNAIDDFFTQQNQPGLYIVRQNVKDKDPNSLGFSGKMLELYRAYHRQKDNEVPTQFKKFHIARYNNPNFLRDDRGTVFSGEREHVDVFYIINGN
jgi:hypothetical protein